MLQRNTFIGNQSTHAAGGGGGIFCKDNASLLIGSSTFYGNSAAGPGSGLYCDVGTVVSVEKCIIAFGTELPVYAATGATVNLSCTDIYGNTGGDWVGSISGQLGVDNNFSADPQFCDAAGGDVQLFAFSPCTVGNSPCGELVGAKGIGCYICGDANSDGSVTWLDYTFLRDYFFYFINPPIVDAAVDMDCDGYLRINDVVTLGRYTRGVGPMPCCVSTSAKMPVSEPSGFEISLE